MIRVSGNLNAKDNVYVSKVYSEKLDELIEDKNTNNIAVTAPYDSGKTTMLKSYFKNKENNYKWYIQRTNKFIDRINKIKKYFFFQPNLLANIKDYEFINIPNFFNTIGDEENQKASSKDGEKEDFNTESDRNKINTEIELEKSIIEQLLYKPNTNKYPDSNLSRLKVRSKSSILCSFIYFIFVVSYLIRLFGKSSIFLWFNSLPIWNNFIFQLVSFAVIGIGTWKTFNSMIHAIGRIKLHASTKMGPVELSGDTEHDKGPVIDLFNYYGDELQYYFHRNNIRVVIFEDLDRFNTPLIFQKLHELNSNLNKSGNSITFIYSLKDKVFSVKGTETSAAALKAKFFDAIIPVFPIHSYRDSSKTFISESEQYGLANKDNSSEEDYFKERDAELPEKESLRIRIDDKYLRGLGLYISDTREIKNIISETYFYFSELPLKIFQEDANAINKLLAMMVYKNEFPDDFDNLASGKRAKLENFINSIWEIKSTILNTKIKENNKEINDLNSKIEKLKSQLISDISILMQIRMQEALDQSTYSSISINNQKYEKVGNIENVKLFWKNALQNNLRYKNYYNDEKIIDNIDEIEKEIFSLYLFHNKMTNEIISDWNNTKEKIEQNNEEIQKKILGLSIQDIFTQYLADLNTLQNSIESVNFIKDSKILGFLFTQGLIGFDYTDYISPDPYNLTSTEESFIKAVINRININEPNYRLPRIKSIIHEIDCLDNSLSTYKYAYSPDVLAYFAIKEDSMNYVNVLVESAKEKNQPEFILNTIESLKDINLGLYRLIESISEIWVNYYSVAFDNNERSNELAHFLLSYLYDENSPELFNALKDQKIFENQNFKEEFLILGEYRFIDILKKYDPYLYSDVSFVSEYSVSKLKQLIIYKWYEENKNNFEIIFDKLADNNLQTLIDNRDELRLSEEFIEEHIFSHYIDKKNATYSDLLLLRNFSSRDAHKVDEERLVNIFSVYLETREKLNEANKKQLLDKLSFVDFINNGNIESFNLLIELLEDNKLIYDKVYFSALYKKQRDIALKYALKFENADNIEDFFYGTDWKFTLDYFTETKLPRELVNLIDQLANRNEPNTEWTTNISSKSCQMILKYTKSTRVIKELMELCKNSKDKWNILKRIFNEKTFKNSFTKAEISQFIFDNNNFINSWIINGQVEILSNKAEIDKYRLQLEQLFEALPLEFKKKGTNKFILRKSFGAWFKE